MLETIKNFLTTGSLPTLESKWSILASVFVILSVVGGGIYALIKLFLKGDGNKSNKANVKNVKDSKVTIDQKNE
jgi:hypothetical protein